MKKQTTKTNGDAYKKALYDYEVSAESYFQDESNATARAEYEKNLYNVGKMITQSVMKKVYDASGNIHILRLRQSFMHDISILDKVDYGMNIAYTLDFNSDGDMTQAVNDESAVDALKSASHETLSDSIDLLNTAIESLINHTDYVYQRFGIVLLETEYSITRRKKHVWIKEEDSKAIEEVETCAIREIYRDVRRAIMDNKAIDGKGKYFYLEEIITDPETGEVDKCYRRLPKYADIGGSVARNTFGVFDGTDIEETGQVNHATVDAPTIGEYDILAESALVDALDLSDRQLDILRLRQRGYGYKAIATYLGLGVSTVRAQISRIQDKVKTCGEFSTDLIAKYSA